MYHVHTYTCPQFCDNETAVAFTIIFLAIAWFASYKFQHVTFIFQKYLQCYRQELPAYSQWAHVQLLSIARSIKSG